jgi:radical SAM protein (TIGR04043 family)
MDALLLKTALLCQGMDTGKIDMRQGRKGGAGPAGSCFEIDGMLVNVMTSGTFAKKSPFKLHFNGEFSVVFNYEVFPLKVIGEAQYYSKICSDGTPMKKIALLHGYDCLATTLYQRCVLMGQGKGCSFCAIETSLKSGDTVSKKTPQQLAEVVTEASEEGITHITITTGTPNLHDYGAGMLAEAVRYLKENSDIPVHVQLTPAHNSHLELLYNAGADTIGIHVESFDRQVMKRVCPGKAELDYKETLEWAVKLFGENQVSSFIIGGLGETSMSMKEGFEDLAALGVIPFLVPFRPLPGAKLQNHTPPKPTYMRDLYVQLARVLVKHGVDIEKNRAGCVRCGACSAIDVALVGRT